MPITLKYYKTVNNKGSISKDIGWDYKLTRQNLQIQEVEGVATIIKNEEVPVELTRLPRADYFEEVSEQEYDAIDITFESDSQSLTRLGSEITFKKLQDKFQEKLDLSSQFLKAAQSSITK